MAQQEELRWQAERERMVTEQLAARGIADAAVLWAMREVPRHAFVPHRLASAAYEDHPLQLGHGQTISQPYVVALTLAAATLTSRSVVLDVGTGSGYAAAVASLIARTVISIERVPALADSAATRLRRHGYAVTVVTGDGVNGWPEAAPYDAIVAAAAAASVPPAWIEQLTPSGRIVMPVGAHRFGQRLIALTKTATGRTREEDLGGVSFVPLISDKL